MKPTITHLALHVENLSECVRFYEDFCHMSVVHQREEEGEKVVWMAEEGRGKEFVFVFISGGKIQSQSKENYSHFGFSVKDRASVDLIAKKAETKNCLVWKPTLKPYPVGYFCGLKDPNGNIVEFSFGQPLGGSFRS